MVEFFLTLPLLIVFLLYLFDVSQRVSQLSWVNQVTYIVSFLGSEYDLEHRIYNQNNLIRQKDTQADYNGYSISLKSTPNNGNKTLIDAQNFFWKLNPYFRSTVQDSIRTSKQLTEHTKITGSSNGTWNPMLTNQTSSQFSLYSSNYLNAITSDSYLTASNSKISNGSGISYLNYDWCGRLCGKKQPCPQSNEVGYTSVVGVIVPTVLCP